MKPSDMPQRRNPYENPTGQTAYLIHLAEQAVYLMNFYKHAGLSEPAALDLTIDTLERYDTTGEENDQY